MGAIWCADLAVNADAMIENNRPGVADRLGIGYADIRRLNPKIVYCSICGFGPKGQSANAPAYDPVIQGFSGMAFLQGGRRAGRLRSRWRWLTRSAG